HIETTTLSSLLSLVEQGIGACVLPRLLLENLKRPEIAILSLSDPTPGQDICILYRSDKYIGFAARAFLDALQAYIRTATEQAGI
ncbi:MAG: transcriptional regulator, partial [Paenibacillus sp.]|nr:transcriptional regulator [Paenibacillus sp.]